MGTISTAPSELHLSMDLDHVFLHFFARLSTLPRPRSVAEAQIPSNEVDFLAAWFSEQFGKPRNWCERIWQETVEGSVRASSQEMFGALFLVFAAETCREHGDEESVWPAIRSPFKKNKVTYGVLFDAGGQPSSLCKEAIAAGARRLELRNLIDRYGTQEYFETLKLQIGFTRKGAVRRLPEWLDGQGSPTAVQILSGSGADFKELGLASTTFADIWKTLQEYRRNRVSEEYAEAVLRASPWVREPWVSELLSVAKLRPSRSKVAPEATESRDTLISDTICEPILQWNYPQNPHLLLKLNEEKVCDLFEGFETATFSLDGKVVDRWTMEESGEWRGNRLLPCEQPGTIRSNLKPRLLSIMSGGTPLLEVNLQDATPLGEPLLLFDLKTGRQVDTGSRIDAYRDYGLLCEPDMAIPNARFCKMKDRSAFLLSNPIDASTQVLCDGVSYWQPRLTEVSTRAPLRLTLETGTDEFAEIDSRSHLVVKAVPEDATSVSLTIGNMTTRLVHRGEQWCTEAPQKLSLGLALHDERVRIRVRSGDSERAVIPKLSLRIRGVAVIDTQHTVDSQPMWELLKSGRHLDRSGGSGDIRVFFETRDAEVYEGACFIGRLTSRAIDMRALTGWGSPLIVRPEYAEERVLIDSVEDHGCVGYFLGKSPGTYDTVCRRTPQEPGPDHAILVWNDLTAQPQKISGRDLRGVNEGYVWKIPPLTRWAAIAVAFKGACLGATWNRDPVLEALSRSLTARNFAVIRWLKLPVLGPALRSLFQQAVLRAPTEFMQGWLGKADLGMDLLHRPAEQGLDTVVREVLWNYIERNENRLNVFARASSRSTSGESGVTEADLFKRSLLNLAEVCPNLAFAFAKARVRGDRYTKLLRSVASEILGQPSPDINQLRTALVSLGRECALLIGISQNELGTKIEAYRRYLDGGLRDAKVDTDLRRLGERKRGRQYVAASLLIGLLERSAL